MDRRQFLKGIGGILAAGAAPGIITMPGLLMPCRGIVVVPALTVYNIREAARHALAAWIQEQTAAATLYALNGGEWIEVPNNNVVFI